MKKISKKDFSITTRGIEIIQNISIFQLVVTTVIGIVAFIVSLDISTMFAIGVLFGTLLLILPAIIIICLINMIIDYMHNIEEQSKIQSNIDITSRKILEELQIINSYNC